MKKYPRILFFIRSVKPTPEEYAEAIKYGSNVGYRNASMMGNASSLEKAEGVAGAVPEVYKDYPTAKEAIAKHEKAIEAEIADYRKKAVASKKAGGWGDGGDK